MTFAEFVTAVRQQAFPEGYAEEMDARHRAVITDALIDIQRKVPCQQIGHRSVFNYDDTVFNCGTSIVTAPDGFIMKPYTIDGDDWCSKVFYQPVDIDFIRCRMNERRDCYGRYVYVDGVTEPIEYGSYEPYSGWDKSCRSKDGWVALYRGELHFFPHIQSTEKIIVDWDGIQIGWADGETVTFNRIIQSAVEWYLKSKSGGFEEFDAGQYVAAGQEYRDAITLMIVECKKKNAIIGSGSCFNNCLCGD